MEDQKCRHSKDLLELEEKNAFLACAKQIGFKFDYEDPKPKIIKVKPIRKEPFDPDILRRRVKASCRNLEKGIVSIKPQMMLPEFMKTLVFLDWKFLFSVMLSLNRVIRKLILKYHGRVAKSSKELKLDLLMPF